MSHSYSFFPINSPAYCDDYMDELDVDITVDETEWDKLQTVSFNDIPSSHDENTAFNTPANDNNSFTIVFSKTVDLRKFEIGNLIGEGIPSDATLSLIITDKNGNTLSGTNNEPITDVMRLVNGNVELPDNFPPVKEVQVIVVSATVSSFDLKTRFIGCIHPVPRTYKMNYDNSSHL